MTVSVFVLRLREGLGKIPPGQVVEIGKLPDTRIVDELSRMLLVESQRGILERYIARNPGVWTLREGEAARSRQYTLPTQRRSLGQRVGRRERYSATEPEEV